MLSRHLYLNVSFEKELSAFLDDYVSDEIKIAEIGETTTIHFNEQDWHFSKLWSPNSLS